LPVEANLGTAVSLDPIFYTPEDHLHKDGLWTHPPAENPAIGHGEKGYEDHPDDHGDNKEVKILRPEWQTKNIKPAFQHIEHQELVPVNFYKRRQ